jgi:hypothetical protein
MWDIFQSPKMNTFVVSELPVAHVTVILDDFAYMLGRKILKTY